MYFPTINRGQITIVNWPNTLSKKSSFWGREREIFMMVWQKYHQSTRNSKTNRMVVLITSEKHFTRRNRRKTAKFWGGHFFAPTPVCNAFWRFSREILYIQYNMLHNCTSPSEINALLYFLCIFKYLSIPNIMIALVTMTEEQAEEVCRNLPGVLSVEQE